MVPWNRNSEDDVLKSYHLQEAKSNHDREGKPESRPTSPQPPADPVLLELGHYRGVVVPLSILFFGYTCGSLAVYHMDPDPRVSHWLLMGSSIPTLAMCILYVLFSIVWGPRLMKNRKPFKLRRTMIAYNVFQIVFSFYVFYEVGMSGWFFEYSYRCQACDYSLGKTALRMASAGWFFYFSKILDFVDTLFFILNKKWSHVSLLHVVHHSCMCTSMWFGIAYSPGGHITFMGLLNSAVHTIMYTYYLLSLLGPALKPYLWWKKYLTTIQLVQFVAIFGHAAQLFFVDCPSVPIGLAIWTCIYAFIFFALFIDFFNKAYIQPVKKTKPQSPTRRRKQAKIGVNYIEEMYDSCAIEAKENSSLNRSSVSLRLATSSVGDTNTL